MKLKPARMKKILTAIVLIVAAAHLRAQSPAASEPAGSPTAAAEDAHPRWSVAGEWQVTHPLWRDVVTLSVDGSFVTSSKGLTGKWILSASGGTPMIVLLWDLYGTESLTMVDISHFRGQVEKGKYIDMRRTVIPR
jgi:hypothetical protein